MVDKMKTLTGDEDDDGDRECVCFVTPTKLTLNYIDRSY